MTEAKNTTDGDGRGARTKTPASASAAQTSDSQETTLALAPAINDAISRRNQIARSGKRVNEQRKVRRKEDSKDSAMARMITPQFLFETINYHLYARHDLWHVVNGPKREVWFNAEVIAALSRGGPTTLSAGFRVYGEESYFTLAKIIKEEELEIITTVSSEDKKIPDITVLEGCYEKLEVTDVDPSDVVKFNTEVGKTAADLSSRKKYQAYGEELRCPLAEEPPEEGNQDTAAAGDEDSKPSPDVTAPEKRGNPDPFLTIIEAKLISPSSTKKDGDQGLKSNYELQLKALRCKTEEEDSLFDQLERAGKLFPPAQVFGLVYAVHRPGHCATRRPDKHKEGRFSQCDQVSADSFFNELSERITDIFSDTQWCLWEGKVKVFKGLQNIKSLGGIFVGQASIGLGILVRNPDLLNSLPNCSSEASSPA